MNDYQKIIAEFLICQMEIMGPAAAVSIARRVPALTIADDGAVQKISGNARAALEAITEEFVSFSGAAAQLVLRAIMKKHPETKLL